MNRERQRRISAIKIMRQMLTSVHDGEGPDKVDEMIEIHNKKYRRGKF